MLLQPRAALIASKASATAAAAATLRSSIRLTDALRREAARRRTGGPAGRMAGHSGRACLKSPLLRRPRPCPASSSSPPPCRTPTASSTSATSWNTSRPTSGCGFQRMQGHEVHFVCADDAHGAPIMIAAEKAGKTPQAVRRRDRRRPQALPRRLPHRASTTGTRPTAPRTTSWRSRSTATCARHGLIANKHDRAVLRPGEEHVPAGPLHQGRVPELPRQGPVRRQLRGLQRGLRADRPDQPVLGAVRRDAGAEAPSTSSSSCRSALRRLPQGWTRSDGPAAARGAEQDQRMVHRPTSTATAAWATGTSAATRPTSASRSPMRRASTSTSGSTRRSATWPR